MMQGLVGYCTRCTGMCPVSIATMLTITCGFIYNNISHSLSRRRKYGSLVSALRELASI